jgi:transmembrane sensor
MNTQPNWELLAAYLAGEATPEQQQSIQQWLAESPKNEAFLAEMRQLWQTKMPEAVREIDPEAAFNKLNARLQKDEPTPVRPLYRFWWAAAASITLLVGVLGYLRWGQKPQTEWLTKTTAQHEKVLITLGDQTQIWLNQNSTLRYPKTFVDNTREVSLDGEAFFKVAKNPEKPFVVSSSTAQVKVLGTAFNLRTDAPQQEFETVVVEGKVAFSVKSKGQVTLTANQAGRIRAGDAQIVTSKVDADEFMGWRTGKLIFRDTDLKEVIVELENWYKVKIEVQNPAILNKKLTGTFDNIALKRALDRLSELLSVQYEQQSEEKFVIR